MNAIADTGFLVAFARAADTHHNWALSLARRIREPLLTCESVLSEAAFHLRSTAYVLALIDDGLVRLAFAADEHLPALARLARSYRDREPDFADLCLIRMSELFPNSLWCNDSNLERRRARPAPRAGLVHWTGGQNPLHHRLLSIS